MSQNDALSSNEYIGEDTRSPLFADRKSVERGSLKVEEEDLNEQEQ